MNGKKIQSLISALILYGTEQEKRFAQSAEQCLNREGRLTERQKLILENFYREKTRWMKHAIISMKAEQNSMNQF
jgi:hypothetical protein